MKVEGSHLRHFLGSSTIFKTAEKCILPAGMVYKKWPSPALTIERGWVKNPWPPQLSTMPGRAGGKKRGGQKTLFRVAHRSVQTTDSATPRVCLRYPKRARCKHDVPSGSRSVGGRGATDHLSWEGSSGPGRGCQGDPRGITKMTDNDRDKDLDKTVWSSCIAVNHG